MKKRISAFVLCIASLCLMLCSCSFGKDETTVDQSTELTTVPGENSISTPAIPETGSSYVNETTTHFNEPTNKYETTTINQLPPVITLTSNGYTIVQKNGITYVDDVLIANKTYSLPFDYNPGALTPDCTSAFNSMAAAAKAYGCNLYIASGFRSYSLQTSIYNRYVASDGKANADTYSARPGYSEHQTGLAIDLNSISYSFANTAEGKWVAENCCKYGFILRYPKDKEAETGYRYEPWHIRYVGVDAATAIYNSGLCLEEYYGITSVYAD